MYIYMHNSDDDKSILVLIRPFNNGDGIVNVSMESISSFLSLLLFLSNNKRKRKIQFTGTYADVPVYVLLSLT